MLLIQHGLLYTMETRAPISSDILIKDGKIAEISQTIIPSDEMEVLDATNLLIFPGFIDAHSHIGISEEKVTGAMVGPGSSNPVGGQFAFIKTSVWNATGTCFPKRFR